MSDIQQSLPWLQESWGQLSQYITQNRIPQALLIIGNKGLGKKKLAEYFIQSLLCTAKKQDGAFCGNCQSCTLFQANTHPDYSDIEPAEEGKVIGIDVIRQLTSKLALKPQFESHRAVLINPAENLNTASANAFLKYLEEPTERTSLILLCEQPFKLPATIKSRCQKLLIAPPDRLIVKDWMQQQGLSENIDLILNLSLGAPLLAKQFYQDSSIQLREQCFSDLLAITKPNANIVTVSEKWQKLDKKEIDFVVFCLISWVVDMIKLNWHQPNTTLLNPDLASNLQELTKQLDLKCLYKFYDFLLICQQRFDSQLNKQLIFEEILIRWLKLYSR